MIINGPTVGTPMPRTNYEQTDPSKADYLKGRDALNKKIQDAQTVASNAQAAADNAQTAANNANKYTDDQMRKSLCNTNLATDYSTVLEACMNAPEAGSSLRTVKSTFAFFKSSTAFAALQAALYAPSLPMKNRTSAFSGRSRIASLRQSQISFSP